MNPFSSNDRSSALAEAAPTPGAPEATTGTGTVHVHMGDTESADDPATSVVETSAVEASAFGASTVGPSAVGVSSITTSAVASSQVATDDIATFTVGLTNEDEPSIQIESVILESAGDAPPASATFENVAAGRWTVSATGRAADGAIVIEGSRRSIVVEANATIDVSLVLFRIGSSDIAIDPVDGSVTHGGAGERRSTLSMTDTSSLDLSLSNVVLSGSGGWGIAFHGEVNGYTI